MPLLCTVHRLYGNFRRYRAESICQFLGQELAYCHFLQPTCLVVQCRPFFLTDHKVQRERYFSLDELEEESYSPIDDFYDEEELLQKRSQLLAELKKLPEQEYNVLVKIVLEDKKYKEVAEELHISVNTVKTHLSRALKMLRRFNMIEILILFNL